MVLLHGLPLVLWDVVGHAGFVSGYNGLEKHISFVTKVIQKLLDCTHTLGLSFLSQLSRNPSGAKLVKSECSHGRKIVRFKVSSPEEYLMLNAGLRGSNFPGFASFCSCRVKVDLVLCRPQDRVFLL